MAIEGPLRELALSDVLQLLDLSRKTGVLSVQRDGGGEPVLLHLDAGAVTGVRGRGQTRRIGELLLLAGRVTEAQLQGALARQREAPGRPLGALLVEAGVAAAEEVARQLRFQVEEAVYALVRVDEGYFHFQEGPARAVELPIRVPTEPLLMEAARRADEWSALAGGWSETDLVPTLLEAAGGGRLQLNPFEWEVLAAVDGERSLRGLAREVGRGEFEVAKAVFALVNAGVVAVGSRSRPREQAAPGRAGAAGDPLLAESYRRRGLAAVQAGELEEAEAALQTALRLTDPADAAPRDVAARALAAVRTLRELTQEEQP